MPHRRAQGGLFADKTAPAMPGDEVHVRVDLPQAGRRLRRRARAEPAQAAETRRTQAARQGIRASRFQGGASTGRKRARAQAARPSRAAARRATAAAGDSAAGNSVFFSPAPARLRWSVPCWITVTVSPKAPSSSGSAPQRARPRARAALRLRRQRAQPRERRIGPRGIVVAPPEFDRAPGIAPARQFIRQIRATRRSCASAARPSAQSAPRFCARHRGRCAPAPGAAAPPHGRSRPPASAGVSADSSTTSSRPRSAKQRARSACSVSAPPANGTTTARAPARTVSSSVL